MDYYNDLVYKQDNERAWVTYIKGKVYEENNSFPCMVVGKTGCQPKGSKVLMADGDWKNIEDIKEGNMVLSPQLDKSNKFCKVIKTTQWFSENNYDIVKLNRGKTKLYSCSNNHLLPLYHYIMPRRRGLRKSEWHYWVIKNYKTDIFSKMSDEKKSHNNIGISSFLIDKFKDRTNCEVEPYTLGFYLGDGHFSDYYKPVINKNYKTQKRIDKLYFHNKRNSSLTITTMDIEVMEEISKYYHIRNVQHKKDNKAKSYYFSLNSDLFTQLKKYGLANKKSGDKFIPKQALLSDAEYRKKLLSGLIDSDGYYKKGGYDYTTKSNKLAKDVLFLVHSLGGRGKIRKIIKKIKSINFEGEYFAVSFYLKDLKLDLKCKRKIKKISSIYKDSNRISINAINNNKKNMVYGFTLESESGLYITDNYMITHNSGKSYSVLRLCQELEPDFQLEGNWFFRAEKFMKAFTDYYKDNVNSKRAKIWVLDEAGVDLNSLKYQNNINKSYSSLFQTSRFRNYIFFGTVPFMDFISKQVRKLMHHRMDAKGVEKNKSVIIPRCLEWNERKEDFYYKRLICQYPDKETKKINRMLLPLARKSLLVEYEERRRQFSDDVNQELVEEAEQSCGGSRKLDTTYLDLIELIKGGCIQNDIAQELNLSVQRVKNMLMILRKKGWDFAYKKTNNQVYDPETKKWEIYPKNKDEVKKDATT